MFTGLIEEVGFIKNFKSLGGGKELTISSSKINDDLNIDDSVAINGVCQTVVAFGKDFFTVQAIEETMKKTTFEKMKNGDKVNLERARKLSDRMGGHLVQGHVDCIGTIDSIQALQTGINVWISFPEKFDKLVVNTGSICIDGISLTVSDTAYSKLQVSIIPHTWKVTSLNNKTTGSKVNLEFDIIGKYLAKFSLNNKKSNLDYLIDQPEW